MKTFVRITSAFVLKDGWVRAVLAMFLLVVLASRVRFSVSSKLPKKLRGRVGTRGENSSKTVRLSFRLEPKIFLPLPTDTTKITKDLFVSVFLVSRFGSMQLRALKITGLCDSLK